MKSSHDMDKRMSMMQENMLKMHEQMHKIGEAKSPQERERLTQEHQQTMRQHMQTMKDSGMMGQGMAGGEAKSNASAGKELKNGSEHLQ